jgi:hypothetical protein
VCQSEIVGGFRFTEVVAFDERIDDPARVGHLDSPEPSISPEVALPPFFRGRIRNVLERLCEFNYETV